MVWATTIIALTAVSASNMLLWGLGKLLKDVQDSVTDGYDFHFDEEAEVELTLWEHDRDGRIAIDNFFRREPEDGRRHHPQAHRTRSNSVSAGA